ncbi:hypothetical protein F0562_011755 [Nyssa sinensis]|uniref:F-box associated beta-propeller type 3 domain-containing protein n=1 Tax=Nyssa sinensis TaxID=561372 RepID=A0A5J4ZUM2_9ASTE|nr:hypothetical protein F0562_011755 [Nyssa sinensis]
MVSLWSGAPHCHVVAALDLAEEKYSFDLWVMNEYGKNESWRKVRITMPCITGIEAYAFLKPLCLTKMGEIVLRIGARKLILYNEKAETLRDLEINGMPGQFDTVTYVESLISPNADDYTGVQYQ